MILIGLTGFAGAGKTMLARHLARHHDFKEMAFADPLKDMIAALFGIERDQFERMYIASREAKESPVELIGQSPRYLLQTLGTEWGRQLVNPDIWVIALQRRLAWLEDHLPHANSGVVIHDIRFENEAYFIRRHGGLVIHVDRPGLDRMQHASETGIARAPSDVVIENDGRIHDAFVKLDRILHTFLEQQAA